VPHASAELEAEPDAVEADDNGGPGPAAREPEPVEPTPAPHSAPDLPPGEEGTEAPDDGEDVRRRGPRALPKRARPIRQSRTSVGDESGETTSPSPSQPAASAAPVRPARAALRQPGQRPRLVIEDQAEESDDRTLAERVKDVLYLNITGPRRPSAMAMAHYSRKLSSLISAGIPLVRSLRLLAERSTSNRALKSASFDVARDVERGMSLGEAFEKHPYVFDRLFIGVVRTGELGGILEEALRRLSEILERRALMRKRVVNALIYPAILVALAIATVVIIMVFVVPVFLGFFDSQGKELPRITQVVLGLSNHLSSWWHVEAILLIGGLVGLRYLIRTRDEWRRGYEAFLLSLPKFGHLFRLVNSAQVARTVGNLLAAGIPLWECLDVTARTSESRLLQIDVEAARDAVEQGRKLESSFRESRCVLSEFTDVVGIGEETGMLERLLLQLADDYEEDVRIQIDTLLELLKPALLLVLAGVVVFILLAVYLPYFSLINALGT